MDIDVFISHHTNSSLHIVEAIANKLEANGVRCWYAPRNTEGGYAGSIARAINSCSIFLLILNKPASESMHVLNEIDLATKRLSKKEKINLIPFHVADDDIGEDAQYYLGRLHWIDAMTPPMFKRIEELVAQIVKLLGRENTEQAPAASQPQYRLLEKIPQAREVFVGREALMEAIGAAFAAKNRILFLEGIGGIGKSELAKQYALANRDQYQTILFVTYTGSLCELVCDPAQLEIEGLAQNSDEQPHDFFKRKMQVFRSLADEHTLLIVDNFDVDSDPDFREFTEGRHHVLFTTRNSHPGFHSIQVSAIPDQEQLFQIFEQNYGMPLEEEDRPFIEEMLRLIENHTYTVELLAKQMEASFLSAKEMLQILQNGKLAGGLAETIAGRENMNTAFGHICSLFSVSSLSEEEKQILRELSLMGIRGVPASRFREWAELSSFEEVNRLIRRSWIRREPGQKLSLHPLVCEVVRKMLIPDIHNCAAFLDKMTDFLYWAWYRTNRENSAVTDNILAVAEYFSPFEPEKIDVWLVIPSFLWQVGEFENSIRLAEIVYQTCLAIYGEASMTTGFAAKMVGGCYFNSGKLRESMPWYQQGLRSMLLSEAPESEDLAMSYEKVGRCCTWEYEQDFEKAAEYLEQALAIRLRLKDAFERGETPTMFEKREHYDLEKAVERIGETYMEMGRLYQKKGDYEKALHYVTLYAGTFSNENDQNNCAFAYSCYDKGICLLHLGLEKRQNDMKTEAQTDLEQARDLFLAALEINLKMRGQVALDTIRNQEALGDVYAALGEYANASNYYMAVISAYEKSFGKDYDKIRAVEEKMYFSAL